MPTWGAATAKVAALLYRRPLQPWQRFVADVAGEIDPATGRFVHPVVVLHVPRRAGKTVLVLATQLQRALTIRGCRGWYTAQRGQDAGRIFRTEWAPTVESSALAAHVKVRRAQGSESFTIRRRASLVQIFPPTETALHSQSADLVVVDEAWAHDVATGEAIESGTRPAQLTRPHRQTWVVSAGGTVESTWFDAWLSAAEAALADGDPSIALFDWSADRAAPGYDPRSPETWRLAHPAVGDTIAEAALAEDLRTMGLAAFERSVLNVWDRPSTAAAGGPIDLDDWVACSAPDRQAATVTAIAVDVAGDRGHAAVATCGPGADGLAVLEVVDYRPGTAWVAPTVRALRKVHRGAVVTGDALALAAIDHALTAAGVDVTLTGPQVMGLACATLVDSLRDRTVTHRGQAVLSGAFTGAATRRLGDAGWAWSRSKSAVDVAPLVAVTLALWAHRSTPAVPPPRIVVATAR